MTSSDPKGQGRDLDIFEAVYLNKIMFMRTRSLSNASLCKVAYNNDSNQPFPGINEQL